MRANKSSIIGIVLVITFLYYLLLLLLQDNPWVRVLVTITGLILAGFLCLKWIYDAYKITKDKQKKFWLLIGIGVSLYTISSIYWLIIVIIQKVTDYPDLSYALWLFAYIFFLTALVYKIRVIETSINTSPYLFNMGIFIIVSVSITVHYLLQPILAFSGESTLVFVISILYLVVDLSIIFAILIIYYLSLYSNEKESLLFIVCAFFFQALADMMFVYATLNDFYEVGIYIDAIWLFALLSMGIAAKFVQKDFASFDWKILRSFDSKDTYFPYIGGIVLVILVSDSYNWEMNALSIGISFVFILVITRQIVVMRKNNQLVKEYRYLAYHDSLTSLKNRTSFVKELKLFLKQAETLDTSICVLLLDLDRFKNVNDTLGHHYGDEVLMEAAQRLKMGADCQSEIYRIGGDEFVIIIPDIDKEECERIAKSILAIFESSFVIDNHEINITPSIGISMYPTDGKKGETLLRYSDAAMYHAKETGKNRYHFFNQKLNEDIVRKMTLEIELKKAMQNDELMVHYQPKFELNSKKIIGMEALLRWNHATLGAIPPQEFIRVAEETGQILPLGEWVLRKACEDTKELHKKGYQKIAIAVNVSVRQFEEQGFVELVEQVLEETGLEAKYLELEITESIMQNVAHSTEILKGLKAIGVKTAIDDFGTGYSSLHVLKTLPIDTIKIDKSFIDQMEVITNFSIVKTIIDIGLNLNLKVIAEGIETHFQHEILIDLGCELGQGYLFSQPVSLKELENHLLLAV